MALLGTVIEDEDRPQTKSAIGKASRQSPIMLRLLAGEEPMALRPQLLQWKKRSMAQRKHLGRSGTEKEP